ncbi:MAG: hypothetical protein KC503_27395 [Myxococcales bacterium]|nr:hypothetical protein [Myxococcales bacterium]
MGHEVERLDALLVWPPYERTGSHRPYSAPYWLADHLTENGLRADVLDVNAEALRALAIDSELLQRELDRGNAQLAKLEKRKRLTRKAVSDYYEIVARVEQLKIALAHQEALGRPDNAASLRLDGTMRYSDLFAGIAESMLLATLGEDASDAIRERASMQKLLQRDDVTVFRRIIAPTIAAAMARHRPRLLGVCVPFSLHLLPALVIADEVKRNDPSTHVVLGGPVVSLLRDQELATLMGFGTVDTIVKHDGEKPLLDLVRAVRAGASRFAIDRVFTLDTITRGVSADDGEATAREAEACAVSEAMVQRMRARQRLKLLRGDVTDRPTAEVADAQARQLGVGSDISGDVPPRFRYPEHVLERLPRETPIMVLESRGCYWGECTFCDFINIYGENRYTPRRVEQVLDDLEYYCGLGFWRFWVSTDSLPPRPAREISRGILDRGLQMEWTAFVKIDRRWDVETLRLMREAGFDGGIVGMEAAHPRLLEVLRKGYDDVGAHEFMRKAREADFSRVWLNVIIDPPTATHEESSAAVAFCNEYRDRLQACRPAYFVLTSTSEIGMHPERFGVELIGSDSKSDRLSRLTSLRYRSKGGMSAAEREEIRQRLFAIDREVFCEWCYGGLGPEVLSKTAPQQLAGWRFEMLDRVELVLTEVVFNQSGWKPKGDRPQVLRHLTRHEELGPANMMEVNSVLASVISELAGRTLTLREIAEHLHAEYEVEGHPALMALAMVRNLLSRGFLRRIIADDGRVGQAHRKRVDNPAFSYGPAASAARSRAQPAFLVASARTTPQ